MNRADIRSLDIGMLRTFEALMRERSVSRAAARLFLSQTAVSASLQRLREGLVDALHRACGVGVACAVAGLVVGTLSMTDLTGKISSMLFALAPGNLLLTLAIIALLGQIMRRRLPRGGPGQVQEIPPYALPRLKPMLRETWARTSDILTIVTPLLVGGSVVLALLAHVGADKTINTLLMPVTTWWLGLPMVLGVPLLFGVLRKELSLVMIYQALGSFEISQYMNAIQIITFLLFMTFYVPCISTFAVMVKTLGRRDALYSVVLSVGVALLVSGIARVALETLQRFS